MPGDDVRAIRSWSGTVVSVAFLGPLLLGPSPALAQPAPAAPFQKFLGEYVGEAVSDADNEVGKRDIGLKITARGKGFTVLATAVTRRAGGKTKATEYAVNLQPTRRPNLYTGVGRVDMFGNAVALDPLSGDPYVWARIEGPVLWVYGLIITETGGYELHVWERALTSNGLSLKYSRIQDGQTRRAVTGTLRKVR